MNRYWRVALDDAGNARADTNHAARTWRDDYTTQRAAEAEAAKLARQWPGVRYVVYEVVSSFVVSGLVRETPGDLIAEAKDAKSELEEADLEEPPGLGDILG